MREIAGRQGNGDYLADGKHFGRRREVADARHLVGRDSDALRRAGVAAPRLERVEREFVASRLQEFAHRLLALDNEQSRVSAMALVVQAAQLL